MLWYGYALWPYTIDDAHDGLYVDIIYVTMYNAIMIKTLKPTPKNVKPDVQASRSFLSVVFKTYMIVPP